MAARPLANESPEYRKLRAELLDAERALRDQIERVAALRCALPADTAVEDQRFEEIREGVRAPVRLSELFERPDQTLVLMHFMYGKKQETPCPMCTLWADGASVFRRRDDGTLIHTYSVNADFAPGELRAWICSRRSGASSISPPRVGAASCRGGATERDRAGHPQPPS